MKSNNYFHISLGRKEIECNKLFVNIFLTSNSILKQGGSLIFCEKGRKIPASNKKNKKRKMG